MATRLRDSPTLSERVSAKLITSRAPARAWPSSSLRAFPQQLVQRRQLGEQSGVRSNNSFIERELSREIDNCAGGTCHPTAANIDDVFGVQGRTERTTVWRRCPPPEPGLVTSVERFGVE